MSFWSLITCGENGLYFPTDEYTMPIETHLVSDKLSRRQLKLLPYSQIPGWKLLRDGIHLQFGFIHFERRWSSRSLTVRRSTVMLYVF